MSVAHLDSSAFVKTVVEEPESQRLLLWLADWPRRSSSELLRTEAVRAVRKHGSDAIERARAELGSIELTRVDRPLLDAIHLAAALALSSDLGVFVTYDGRMAAAAAELGTEAAAPDTTGAGRCPAPRRCLQSRSAQEILQT